VWNKTALHELIESKLRGYRLIIVSNREPWIHVKSGERIECIRPASGMASALDPVMQACGGSWIAHGSGSADRATADACGRVAVPPEKPSYTLRRVWLTKRQENGYYYGLANEGIWPLCHVVFTRPVFNPDHWQVYREVNELFADAVIDEAAGEPAFVFIQDYHFGLLPRMLRERDPRLMVAQFWHIPWPNREYFRAFPWGEELLHGMLGNDLLGFHLHYHCQNFLETVDRALEARVDVSLSQITRGGHLTQVRPFPISIDFDDQAALAAGPRVEAEMAALRQSMGLEGKLVGIGIDRIDYTKGLSERFRAIDKLLEAHPEYRGKLLFVQVGVPSREHIGHYKALNAELNSQVEEINWRWASEEWRPIIYLREHHSRVQMAALHRLARFCFVSSLHDGMNLVAKEFVASRVDDDGVLILSQFTGAARELTDAVLVNPFSLVEGTRAIAMALEMPEEERRRRMRRLREAVAGNNIYRWAGKIMSVMARHEFADAPGVSALS
jgi:trehalose 6-phosphate synthase